MLNISFDPDLQYFLPPIGQYAKQNASSEQRTDHYVTAVFFTTWSGRPLKKFII